jgi:hypothetical protein
VIDRERHIAFLKQAERHVALGARHIADQERRVTELRRSGHDTTRSRDLLRIFRDMQIQHIAHRDLLLDELKRMSDSANSNLSGSAWHSGKTR